MGRCRTHRPRRDVLRLDFGVGERGSFHVESLLRIEGAEIRAVCDIVPEKVAAACPTDRRCRTIDQIMMLKTITMIAAMTHSSIVFRSEMRCSTSVCGVCNQ